jgi:hypothetical protein
VKVDSLIVCDAVTIREGLFHVLGGGITRLWRPTLPGPLGVQIAAVIEIAELELELPHEIGIVLRDAVGADIFRIQGGFQAQRPPKLEDGESVLVPVAFDTRNAGIMTYGRHELTAQVDSGDVMSRAFWILHPEELQMPSLTAP